MKPVDDLDDPQPDEAAFEVLNDVLDGRRRVEPDAKMLWILLGDGRDATITRDEFVVHFGPMKRRRPLGYYRRFGPGVLSYILERGGVSNVSAPIVIGLPATDLPRLSKGGGPGHRGPLTVWVVRTTRSVRVVVRAAIKEWRAAYSGPIPPSGLLALPDPPEEWRPAEKVWIDLSEPLECARCGASGSRYRQLPDALICLSCGCSFPWQPGAS